MLSRFREPSTWAAVAAACVGLMATCPEALQPYFWGVMAAATIAGVILPEQPKA